MTTILTDNYVQFGALSLGNMLTASSVATGYSWQGWSLTNFTPLRLLKGDDTAANTTRVLCTLINDLITKRNVP